ncbi:MAG: xanthine dehydrogenase family protein molybdopterin-binding subunit [Bacteroidia bacterium]
MSKKISRRKFIIKASIGTGVIIGTTMAGCAPFRRFIADQADKAMVPYLDEDDAMVWFEITHENKIKLHSPKVEMGQGVFTGLAQLAAEELGVSVNTIDVVNANTTNRPIDSFSTGGSTTISSLWEPLRLVAAKMRVMILNNAAEILKTNVTELSITNQGVTSKSKSISFGEIVQQAKSWNEPRKVELKTSKDFKIIGKPIPRVDLVPKVMGAPLFGIDVSMPNMLYGAVIRSPYIDSKLKSADTSDAAKMPGVVKVVVEPDFIGVVAKSKSEAILAKRAIKAEWQQNKIWQQSDIDNAIKVGQGKPVTIQKQGNVDRIFKNETVIEAEYGSPTGAHAHLEPNGAVVYVEKDKATVRMSTQVIKNTRTEIADRLGFKEDQIDFEATYLGGGFGRRLHTPNAMQAAVMSQQVGKPVHAFLNRQEEFQHDMFRPPTHHLLKAVLDDSGMIKAIEHNVSSGDVAFGSALTPAIAAPIIGADIGAWRGGMFKYLKIPNLKAVSWRVKLPFATSFWRSLGLLANTFAIECFLDELAEKTNKDPIQFRLDQIEDDELGTKYKGVIQAAAKAAEWGKKMPKGSAQGFAASIDVNTPVAQIVEVSVVDNEIKVDKVTCAIDCGVAVNPDGVRAQCEGAIIMGLSAAMFEKMEVKDGQLTPIIYGPYKMARIAHAPKEINTVILESGTSPTGVGEPPLGPIGAAIANAVYKITGKRLRNMPLNLELQKV